MIGRSAGAVALLTPIGLGRKAPPSRRARVLGPRQPIDQGRGERGQRLGLGPSMQPAGDVRPELHAEGALLEDQQRDAAAPDRVPVPIAVDIPAAVGGDSTPGRGGDGPLRPRAHPPAARAPGAEIPPAHGPTGAPARLPVTQPPDAVGRLAAGRDQVTQTTRWCAAGMQDALADGHLAPPRRYPPTWCPANRGGGGDFASATPAARGAQWIAPPPMADFVPRRGDRCPSQPQGPSPRAGNALAPQAFSRSRERGTMA